ncbi:malonyl-coenzyme:anthocyanin 5-O-glucoside-6'''-O-malonyltransferase-like [Sesamum indicum]|uniref:Malonyl-coenzyme:anthocyanin 5-O-glucoside-6'''-O-malonyltransferase-like n=2 Tax=Sesamum indicum TaxID=4182 RepID=A0A6I9U0G1_SESIN|nr:malonyl-coenzyme:anthocyanin 5-O-glucoside-6'''-O-malonyltransferase-like [Sesamum indicum]
MATTILETCRVPAPPGAAANLSLPLTFFDIQWLHFHPIRHLLFYDYPCSKPYFLETVAPKLKESLSLTLRHYLPLAGNLIFPLNSEKKPEIQYVAGDSAVSLTIAESASDFDHLTGNHARDADQFYEFVPEIDPVTDESEYQRVPVVALKVTLFTGRGICVGFANLHCLGDASSVVGFIKAWASISKLGGDEEEFLTKHAESLPILDRSVINDPLGIDTIFWKVIRDVPLKSSSFPLPTNRVRATYILRQADIEKLKDLVLAKKPGLLQVSSFVVTASYVWTCFVKSEEQVDDDDVLQVFIFAADIRARIDPPVPASYFGNCLAYGLAKIEHKQLVGGEGFVIAAEAIADQIKNRLNNKDQVLKGAENWLSETKEMTAIRAFGVSGSPKFDLCSADFGWGRARKLETVSIDGEKHSMSLCKSRDSEGGLEVGISLPKARMDAFAAIFEEGLRF